MTAAAATTTSGTTPARVLHLAFELGRKTWRLGVTTGLGQKVRRKAITGGDTAALAREVMAAKQRFGLGADAPVVSCYEAGPEGFWLHRWLTAHGIANVVVDSASILVDRRRRRAKTDRLDVDELARLLCRHTLGEKKVWGVVRVPPPQIEAARQLHRELATLVEERTRIRNRMQGLLAASGVRLRGWSAVRRQLTALRQWDGTPLAPALRQRLEREVQRLELLQQQLRELQQALAEELATPVEAQSALAMMQQLTALRGIGAQGARVLTVELFAWREFRNGREVGGCSGLTPTPYQSGTTQHEQGIDKAGNRWLRRVAVQLAWSWVRWQPHSPLTQWFVRRFAGGGRRQRKVGIVAVARKLVVALWRYVHGGELPGAIVGELASYRLRVAA
jgi:transposase